MKRVSTIFLQIVVILIGIGAVAFLLWEPHVEGRNAHATVFEIYFKDPFLAYAYVASLPFFTALYQTFKVLGYARGERVFSPVAVKAVQTIRYCAIAIICFVAVGEIFIMNNESDDRAPAVVIGLLLTFGSVVVAAAASLFEGILRTTLALRQP